MYQMGHLIKNDMAVGIEDSIALTFHWVFPRGDSPTPGGGTYYLTSFSQIVARGDVPLPPPPPDP